MSLGTLLGHLTDEQLKALPSRTRSPERVQQSIDAFALHLQGVSFRGIQQRYGWKSPHTAVNAVQRGEELAKKLNLDSEKIRLKIAAAFDRLADITIAQVEEQVKDGRTTLIQHCDGRKEMRKVKGVDPRMVSEAGRGLIRFAEFAGLMDRAPEVHAAATLVQLAAPSNGADFSSKWDRPSEPAPVDVSALGMLADAIGLILVITICPELLMLAEV